MVVARVLLPVAAVDECCHLQRHAHFPRPAGSILRDGAALACTASPALGQVRQELRERGKLGNVSAQTRLELMYDLGRDGTAE